MKSAELIRYCRERRSGVPEGDIRDPRVLADVLGVLLDERLAELESRAEPPSHYVQDAGSGGLVPTVPGVRAPDPREDFFTCQLATLCGYVQDAGRG